MIPNAAISLEASAEAYLICGNEVAAAFCRHLAADSRAMERRFGNGVGDSLYRHWASEQAERASAKLQAFNETRRAA